MISMQNIGVAGIAVGLAVALGLTGAPQAIAAGECTTENDSYDVGQAEARALYDCIEASSPADYSAAGDVPGVTGYRNWNLVSTAPLLSATHGRMFVNHWINNTGVDLYVKWEDMDGARFPVGSIFAKESFRIDRKGVVKRGPLFLMEKVADNVAPDGWVYTRVFPNGKFQRTNGPKSDKMVFCHDCHAATIEDQDAAFFPPEEYRIVVE